MADDLTPYQIQRIRDAERILLKAKKMLDSLDIPFCISSGTLLGIIREGHLLAHEKDVDLAVISTDLPFRKRYALKKLGGCIGESTCQSGWGQISFAFDINPSIHLDISPVYFKGDIAFYNQQDDLCSIFPKKYFVKKNWVKVDYLLKKWNTPPEPEEFLKVIYGENWRTPVFTWNWTKDSLNTRNFSEI